MDWSKLLKKALKTNKELTEQKYAINAPNPAATKGQPGYIESQTMYYHQLMAQKAWLTSNEQAVTLMMPKGHGKSQYVADAMAAMMSAYALGPSDVMIVGNDAKLHHVAQANGLTVNIEATLSGILKEASDAILKDAKTLTPKDMVNSHSKLLKSWIYGDIGGESRVTAPETKPQLQPIFERLSELAEEMPPEGYPLRDNNPFANPYHVYLKPAQPSFTFNGIDFPAEDVESFEQVKTEEGIAQFKVKLKPEAYDKWTQYLKAGAVGPAHPKQEAP